MAERTKKDLSFITNLVKEHGGIERLGKLFHTLKQAYFYDSGTGKVVCLDKREELFFSWLFERQETDGYEQWHNYNNGRIDGSALSGVKDVILQENLLQSPYDTNMTSIKHQSEIKQMLEEKVRLITLELTGRCNLRCGYCIYNEDFQENRNFSESDMSEETARKAIRYLAEHSGNDVSVTFYGGEPLLKFDMMKSCVEYSKELMKGKNLTFSMTSNMTLMTREKAEFFFKTKGFSLVASLDGPREVHNSYRKYQGGKGSFDDTLRGVKILADVFGDEFASRVSLSMVFAPPYTFEKIDRIHNFFEGLDWLPKETDKLISYPEHGSVKYVFEEAEGTSVDVKQGKGYVNTLFKWNELYSEKKPDNSSGILTKKHHDELLLKVHNRPLFNKPSALDGLNGCCVPGTRRLYVTAEGDFKVCERVGVSPPIGNVGQGLIYDDIKRYYVDEYIKESEKTCSECWANRLCGVCYAKTYSSKGIDKEKKAFQCDMARHNALEALVAYHTCLEDDADSMAYLNDMAYG